MAQSRVRRNARGAGAASPAFIQSAVDHFGQPQHSGDTPGYACIKPWSRPARRAGTPSWAFNLWAMSWRPKPAIPAYPSRRGEHCEHSFGPLHRGRRQQLQYDTTKRPVAGLTRGLAMDHAVDGIRVMRSAPAPFSRRFTTPASLPPAKLWTITVPSPVYATCSTSGHAQEVAACVLFLASRGSLVRHGHLSIVDGGFTAL